MKQSLARIFAALVLVALLTACGNDDKHDSTIPTPTIDAATVLQRASARIAETQSMKFTLDVTGTTMIDETNTIQLLGARGSLARPDLVDVQFQARLLGTQTVSIRMISAGGQHWTTDLITGEWGPAPEEFGYDPARLFDMQDGLGPVMGKVSSPQLMGSEDVDGNAAWHVHGTVSQEVIGPITAGTMHGDPVDLDLWIDTKTWDLLEIRLTEPKDAGIEDPATWTMMLRSHNEPVSIEPPV